MSDSDPLSRAKGSKFGCLSILGWVILAAALTVVLTLLLFWRMGAEVTQEARRMAESLASDFDKVFQFTPQISVDSVVVIAANTPVLELVTTQRELPGAPSLVAHLASQHQEPRSGGDFHG